MAVAIQIFFASYSLAPGGFTGVSIIIQHVSTQMGVTIPIWATNLMLNVPLILLALRARGFMFVIKTIYSIFSLSAALFLFEFLPPIEMDLAMAAIFGGVLLGTGVGLVCRCMASTGGTDLIASIVNKYRPQMSIQKVLFAVDSSILLIGFFVFGPLRAMYALIAVYIISKMVERILEGLNFAKAAFIVSQRPKEVGDNIMKRLDRGVTALHGRGMYTDSQKDVILCCVSTKQIITLKNIVFETDPTAFVMVADVREVMGEGFTWNASAKS
jgi:uncharacterized membrane-anchored protein YitT (DUF2179 family)